MFDASIAGIRSNLDMFARAALHLQNIDKADLPAEMTRMVVAEKAVGANVAALRAALEVSRSVIDIVA